MWGGTEMDMIFAIIKITWREKVETFFIHYVLPWNLNVNSLFIVDDYDTVYIAHCYPYTYTKLQLYLRDI